MKAIGVVAIISLGCSAIAFAGSTEVALTEELRAAMQELMVDTKVLAVTELNGPAEGYISDDDPMTLEIVMLSKRSDGPSRVSDDGEVIFMRNKTKDKEQQTLFTTAFYLKAQRKLAEPNKPLQPTAPTSGAPAER